jgi:phosphoadenylyl-sulfate reductase (thioredoxin)
MSSHRDGSEELAKLENGPPEELLKWCSKRFGAKASLATDYGVEDMVLMDMISRVAPSITVFTLDTGRLPEETHRLMVRARERYGLPVKVLFPNARKVENMVSNYGPDLFHKSVDLRKMCCHIRMVEPLRRALEGAEAWIVGSRHEQSPSGDEVRKISVDDDHDRILKICPLAGWTNEMVWDYVKKYDVPYNELHDKGYRVVGCEPCTRAVTIGKDIEASQWWWEKDAKKGGLRPH